MYTYIAFGSVVILLFAGAKAAPLNILYYTVLVCWLHNSEQAILCVNTFWTADYLFSLGEYRLFVGYQRLTRLVCATPVPSLQVIQEHI